MIIGMTYNKFVSFNQNGGDNDSLELNFYINCVNGTNRPIFRAFTFIRFKNN
jgi:hypothetical protein